MCIGRSQQLRRLFGSAFISSRLEAPWTWRRKSLLATTPLYSPKQTSFIPENPLPWVYLGSGLYVNAEDQLVDPKPTRGWNQFARNIKTRVLWPCPNEILLYILLEVALPQLLCLTGYLGPRISWQALSWQAQHPAPYAMLQAPRSTTCDSWHIRRKGGYITQLEMWVVYVLRFLEIERRKQAPDSLQASAYLSLLAKLEVLNPPFSITPLCPFQILQINNTRASSKISSWAPPEALSVCGVISGCLRHLFTPSWIYRLDINFHPSSAGRSSKECLVIGVSCLDYPRGCTMANTLTVACMLVTELVFCKIIAGISLVRVY